MQLISLQHQLRAHQEVEITGPLGRPVYCKGSFQDGDFREFVRPRAIENVVCWQVQFTNELPYADGISLLDLGELEIRLGGVVYATGIEVAGQSCTVRGSASSDTRDDLTCPVYRGKLSKNTAFMAINFRSLPEGPWKHLQSCYKFNTLPENYNNKTDIWHYVTDSTQYPRRIPNQKADVTSISFFGPCVLKLIMNIHRDEEFEKKKNEYVTQIEEFIDGIGSLV